ncbi:MAG: hypothetical protein WD341_01840 [Tistlia sp.]|uniref:hypothetical protein n=1 Tax=Tistlia sp. TaxID=3057121 RepID=UPI0034A2701C
MADIRALFLQAFPEYAKTIDKPRAEPMTRAEAARILAWGRQQAEVVKAMTDRTHAYHRLAVESSLQLHYWNAEHPQTDAGEPLPLAKLSAEQVRSATQAGVFSAGEGTAGAPDLSGLDPEDAAVLSAIEKMTPDQAREAIAELRDNAAFSRSLVDKGDGAQAYLSRAWTRLHELGHGGETARAAAPAAGQSAEQATARSRLEAKQAELKDAGEGHPYVDRLHPGHRDAVAEVTALYQAAAGESAGEGGDAA